MSREKKKRKYYRKCGACGRRLEQSLLIRTNKSPNGWFCNDCYGDLPCEVAREPKVVSEKQALVVYHWASKYGNGYGNVDVSYDADVLSIDGIREVERKIREAYGYDSVIVLNIIKLANKISLESE